MANNLFSFKQFTVNQEKSAFKVGTDAVLLGAVASAGEARRILDIGTGTGVIAIMLAQRSNAGIVAIEPDQESFAEAKANAGSCPWKERIKVVNTDLQGFFDSDGLFDLIVTNPPYFSDSIRNPDPRRSAARHNDSLSGEEILKGASRLLAEDGKLELIMPFAEGNIFIAEAAGFGFYCNNILKIRPLPTSEIRRLILTFSRKQLKPVEKFLTIERGARHEFTDEYKDLTKDFYLKF
jgi:tRNA1Val (adenine37-N6)-methyltransferase